MDIKIQKKPAFTVAGVLLEAIDNSRCPSAWEQLYANHSFESLESLGSGHPLASARISKKAKSSTIWPLMM